MNYYIEYEAKVAKIAKKFAFIKRHRFPIIGIFTILFSFLFTMLGVSGIIQKDLSLRSEHLGGNVYCEKKEGINIHKYGAHIFHTNNREIWQFVNDITQFNRYTNSPVANYKQELYNF